MDTFKVDCLVIGGGVAGLAIGRKLAEHFEDIFLIEKNSLLSQETSSRNSEVIHAGIYYKKNSLKSKLCVEGKKLLYEYLQERRIPYSKCGKFIISTNNSETERLEEIQKNAEESGVDDLRFNNNLIDKYQFLKYQSSLFSPSSGIFDSHEFMHSLKNDFEKNGGNVLLKNTCIKIEVHKEYFVAFIKDTQNNQDYLLKTKRIINAGGLEAVDLINNLFKEEKYKLKLIKGDYYTYSGKEKLSHLIYPIPTKNSLGIHATIDLGSGIRFGPSAYEVGEVDYSIAEDQKKKFYDSIRRYWPEIDMNLLSPGYSGIRAIVEKEEDDFEINFEEFDENVIVNILGYASPGLTSSLALSNYVDEKLLQYTS